MKLEELANLCGHLIRLQTSHDMTQKLQRDLQMPGQQFGFEGHMLVGPDADSVRLVILGKLAEINADAKMGLVTGGVDFSDLTNDFVGNNAPDPVSAIALGRGFDADGFPTESMTIANH